MKKCLLRKGLVFTIVILSISLFLTSTALPLIVEEILSHSDSDHDKYVSSAHPSKDIKNSECDSVNTVRSDGIKIRCGIFSRFVSIYTNYTGIKNKFSNVNKVCYLDVDNSGRDDIEVHFTGYIRIIFDPIAIAFEVSTSINRLPSADIDKNETFEIYLELSIPGFFGRNEVQIGYYSPENNEIPKSCKLTKTVVPYFLRFNKNPEYWSSIDPIFENQEESQLMLLARLCRRSLNNVTIDISMNLDPAVKSIMKYTSEKKYGARRWIFSLIKDSPTFSKATFSIKGETFNGNASVNVLMKSLRTVTFSLEVTSLQNGGQNIEYECEEPLDDVFLFVEKDSESSNPTYLYLKNLPRSVSLEWHLRLRDGYIKATIDSNDDAEIGLCDDLEQSTWKIYLRRPPKEVDFYWNISLLEGDFHLWTTKEGLSLCFYYLKESVNEKINLITTSNSNLSIEFKWDQEQRYFELIRNSEISFICSFSKDDFETNITGSLSKGTSLVFAFDDINNGSIFVSCDRELELSLIVHDINSELTVDSIRMNSQGCFGLKCGKTSDFNINMSTSLDITSFRFSSPESQKLRYLEIETLLISTNFEGNLQIKVDNSSGFEINTNMSGDFTLNDLYIEHVDFILELDSLYAAKSGVFHVNFQGDTPGMRLETNSTFLSRDFRLDYNDNSDHISVPSVNVSARGYLDIRWDGESLDVDTNVETDWGLIVNTSNFGYWEVNASLNVNASFNAVWQPGTAGHIDINIREPGSLNILEIKHNNLTLDIGSFDLEEPGTITFDWEHGVRGHFYVDNDGVHATMTLCKINYSDPYEPFELEIGNAVLSSGNIHFDWNREDTGYFYINKNFSLNIDLIKITLYKYDPPVEIGLSKQYLPKKGEFNISWDSDDRWIEVTKKGTDTFLDIFYKRGDIKITLSKFGFIGINPEEKHILFKWYESNGKITGFYLDTDKIQHGVSFEVTNITGSWGRRLRLFKDFKVDGFFINISGFHVELGGKVEFSRHIEYWKLVSGEWKELDIQWDLTSDRKYIQVDSEFGITLNLLSMEILGVNVNIDFDVTDHFKMKWELDSAGGYFFIDTDYEPIASITFGIWSGNYNSPEWGIEMTAGGLEADDYEAEWTWGSQPQVTGSLSYENLSFRVAWNGNWHDVHLLESQR